jgi:hypothetical protein
MKSPPASSTSPLPLGINAAPWSTIPHSNVSAVAAPPPDAAAKPDVAAVYWNEVLDGMAVTANSPL